MPVDFTRADDRYKQTPVVLGPRGEEFALWEVPDDLKGLSPERFNRVTVAAADVGFLDRVCVSQWGPGTETLWWTIAFVNDMLDPERDMFVGQTLLIPPFDAVRRHLIQPNVNG